MITLGLLMGCDLVRVGFEDSIHLPDGSVAMHNHEMVAKAVEIGALFGMRPATQAAEIPGTRALSR